MNLMFKIRLISQSKSEYKYNKCILNIYYIYTIISIKQNEGF